MSASSVQHEIVIIGAGFVGLACALWLQKSGHRVKVIDPEPLQTGAYYGNACTVATYANVPVATPAVIAQIPRLILNRNSPLAFRWGYLPRLMPWLWQFLLAGRTHRAEQIATELAMLLREADQGFEPVLAMTKGRELLDCNGAMYLYSNAASFAKAQQDIRLRQDNGIRVDILDKGDIAALEPCLYARYSQGLLFNDSYHIRNPLMLLQRMAAAAELWGGQIIRAAAKGVVRQNARDLKVITDQQSLYANKVIVAAGAWSKPFARQFGDRIPLDTEQGYHVMYNGAQALLSRPVGWADGGFYMTPMDSGLRAAGTVEFGGIDNAMNCQRIQMIANTVKTLLPQLQDYDSHWTGFRPSLPDSKPVIGVSAKDDGVLYAFGHGHLGVTLSAITGKLISQLINNEPTDIDISAFSPDRF